MGLRELKAARTRAAIAHVGLDLFERQGYDTTTMEQIAQRAEVSPTTLYRYFPTKESLLTGELFAHSGTAADELRARPGSENLGTALGAVLLGRLRTVDADAERVTRLRRQIDLAPEARARVFDSAYQELTFLEEAIAERSGTSPSEVWVQVTARTWLMVWQTALDMMRSGPEARSAEACAREVLAALSSGATVLPVAGG